MNTENKKARIIKANTMLQAKVGMGTIDDEKIQAMQKVMNETKIDFGPMAFKLLDELNTALARARAGDGEPKALLAAMTEPVMQIKANAAMFDYHLVGSLANIILNFLEHIESIDKMVLDIVDAHHKTLTLMVKGKKTGAGGEFGDQLKTELQEACKRYFARKGLASPFLD